MRMTTAQKNYATAGMLFTWIVVLLQLYLILLNRQASIAETITRFFSFFTILSNILVATCFTMMATGRNNFFTRSQTLTATAVYITIVGLTYNIILRGIWQPQGLQKFVDEGLHVVVPVVFIVYWFLFVPKERISWNKAFIWLAFPAVYLLYSLVRGHFTGFYPYPFINVGQLGYDKALINSGVVCIAFIVVAIIFIGLSRAMAAKNK